MYVYVYSKIDRLWVVGFFEPGGIWHPESDWSTSDDAAKRVSYLNGASNDNASRPPAPALFTVKQFAARNPIYSESALWNIRFKSQPRLSTRGPRKTNGAEKAFITVGGKGGKVLIDEEAFFAWVRQHRQDEL